jgi:hypothetical protein
MLMDPTTFPLPRILQIVLNHDKTMDIARDEMAENKAIYETRWWRHYIAQATRMGTVKNYRWDGAEIEVNRLRRMMRTYLGALYPRASRVVCEADPLDRGDPLAGQASLNAWWKKQYTYLTVDHASLMALTLPGSGLKIGYDPGKANPIERVWMRPIPPWELILDRDAPSWEDERYRGHVYQAPIEEVLERYPQLRDKIKGASRTDFFEETIVGNPVVTAVGAERAPNGEYVRVLEFLNLRDTYMSETGECYKGRLEVYILNQGMDQPVVVTPLPFQDADGRDLPNIEPLIFDHEVGYPFRPIPPARVAIPQCTELNKLRTAMARDTRRNARKWFYKDGAIEQDEIDKYGNGIDGQGIKVKQEIPLDQAVFLAPTQPIAADNFRYTQMVEGDLDRVSGPSQNAQGQAIDTTAHEVQTIQLFTEADIAYHGVLLYGCLARVSRLVQRAILSAGMDVGDSEGGVEDAPVTDLALDPEETEVRVGLESEDPPEVRMTKSMTRPKVHPFEPFMLKVGEDKVEVTAEGLDGDFVITFVNADTTPVNRQTILQFMTGQGLKGYMDLWTLAEKGGAQGLMAERAMQHIAEMLNLPKDMHPAAMKASLKAAEPAKKSEAPKGVAAAMGPRPPVPDPAPPPSGLPDTLANVLMSMRKAVQANPQLAQALQQSAQAVQQAVEAAQAGDMAAVAQAVGAALDALPEGIVPDVAETLAGILQGMSGEVPTEEPGPSELADEVVPKIGA